MIAKDKSCPISSSLDFLSYCPLGIWSHLGKWLRKKSFVGMTAKSLSKVVSWFYGFPYSADYRTSCLKKLVLSSSLARSFMSSVAHCLSIESIQVFYLPPLFKRFNCDFKVREVQKSLLGIKFWSCLTKLLCRLSLMSWATDLDLYSKVLYPAVRANPKLYLYRKNGSMFILSQLLPQLSPWPAKSPRNCSSRSQLSHE